MAWLQAAQAQAYYNWAPAEYDPAATEAAQSADDAATQNGQAAPESEFQYDSASGTPPPLPPPSGQSLKYLYSVAQN